MHSGYNSSLSHTGSKCCSDTEVHLNSRVLLLCKTSCDRSLLFFTRAPSVSVFRLSLLFLLLSWAVCFVSLLPIASWCWWKSQLLFHSNTLQPCNCYFSVYLLRAAWQPVLLYYDYSQHMELFLKNSKLHPIRQIFASLTSSFSTELSCI